MPAQRARGPWPLAVRLLRERRGRPFVRQYLARLNNPLSWRAATIALLLGGCAAGPDYRRPDESVSPSWHAAMQGGLNPASPAAGQLSRWWHSLGDPALTRLVDEAANNNLDLALARARLREARARRGIAGAELFPIVTARAGANRTRSSGEPGRGDNSIDGTYFAQFDASWEADFFGGKRRAVEAADATAEAALEDLRDVQVGLLAEVALNYVALRGYQARLEIARRNLAAQAESWDIAGWRRQAGLVGQLDQDQARSNLEQTRAQLPLLQAGLEQSKNRLAVLLGRGAGQLGELETAAGGPGVPSSVAVGIPAETLRQRPDVRRAERRLAAASAQAGVAAAALYPDFSLSGTIGLQAMSGAGLGHASTRIASVAVAAGRFLFDGGRSRHNIDLQGALQQQALLAYQSAVREALLDVENALVAYALERERRAAIAQAVTAARSAAAIAASQYASGLVDFLTVLDTERSQLGLEDQLSQSDTAVASNLARLYKALGGGWSNASPADER